MAYDYCSCDIAPWLAEIITRMHEAAAAGTNVVNLSFTHPRGFIPLAILRRPKVRELLAGWGYDNRRMPTPVYPEGPLFLPRAKNPNFEFCSTLPWEKEIERRGEEAKEEAAQLTIQTGTKHVPILDLTCYHPRGGIPWKILERLARRQSKSWRTEMEENIRALQGEANKAESFAQTQKDRAEAIASKGGDPKPLLSSAHEQVQKAAQLREQADFIRAEMGEAA